jgi:hypothetical protein
MSACICVFDGRGRRCPRKFKRLRHHRRLKWTLMVASFDRRSFTMSKEEIWPTVMPSSKTSPTFKVPLPLPPPHRRHSEWAVPPHPPPPGMGRPPPMPSMGCTSSSGQPPPPPPGMVRPPPAAGNEWTSSTADAWHGRSPLPPGTGGLCRLLVCGFRAEE